MYITPPVQYIEVLKFYVKTFLPTKVPLLYIMTLLLTTMCLSGQNKIQLLKQKKTTATTLFFFSYFVYNLINKLLDIKSNISVRVSIS
jgi:cytochrome c biogenesis factor